MSGNCINIVGKRKDRSGTILLVVLLFNMMDIG